MHLSGLSIVVPTFDEVLNVKLLVQEISNVMNSFLPNVDYEVIFVDDQSRDGTPDKIKELQKVYQTVQLIENQSRLGLGASVLVGMRSSKYDRITVIDADLTHPVSEIPRLLHVSREYDVVIGSRFCCGGGMENRTNYISSYMYNLLLRLVLRTQIQDSICGFFCVQKLKVMRLLNDDNFKGYGDYFFWFLKGATKFNFSIVEVPVIYKNRTFGFSKSNRWKMLISYTRSAFSCRAFYREKS